MKHQKNINVLLLENITRDHDNMTSSVSDVSWLMVLLDRSQQIMTILGVIANIGTSITLIRNGKVSILDLLKFYILVLLNAECECAL